jgi:amino acid adenylation domain-containing protein
VRANEPEVLGLTRRHVETTPDHPAAEDPSRSLTFAELDAEVRAVAASLAGTGVGEGDRVALRLANSVDFLVAALACAWLGAIFVPLAAGEPASRLEVILKSSEPTVVIVPGTPAGDDIARRTPLPGTYRELSMVTARLAGADPPPPLRAADRPAYCLYTSGTSGTPKGVLTGQRALAAAVNAVSGRLGLHAGSRGLCVSPFHFVGSYGTLFPLPVVGGSLVIPPRESLALPRMFFRILVRERITHTSFSPTYLRLLLGSPEIGLLASSSLVTMSLGGEVLTMADLRALWAAAPELKVFNRYGQTETTIAVTTYRLDRDSLGDATSVPIGPPNPGVRFFVVGDDGRLVEGPGEVGELYIGGDQLMTGYWRDPELTAAALRSDVVAGETLYRTGDLVYRDEEGVYFSAGRADQMVKRSGIRISLMEVVSALVALEAVSAAVCLPYDEQGQLGIVAFVTTSAPSSGQNLRRALAERLPATMLPDRVEIVEQMPMTLGSKVDERLLLAQAGLGLPDPAVSPQRRSS